MEELSPDGKTVSTQHLLKALLKIETQSALHQEQTLTPSERIDLLDAIYNPKRSVNTDRK